MILDMVKPISIVSKVIKSGVFIHNIMYYVVLEELKFVQLFGLHVYVRIRFSSNANYIIMHTDSYY